MDLHSDAEIEELKAKKKTLEDTVQPIITKLYSGGSGGSGESPPHQESDAKEEL